MKMNSLAALRGVCDRVGSPAGEAMLEAYKPRAYAETVGGRTMAQVQLCMCHLQAFLAGFDHLGSAVFNTFCSPAGFCCSWLIFEFDLQLIHFFSMAVQAGCEPILHMRHFQKAGFLSDELVADITSRNA